ncbi:hypothetical protein [Streptomyces sp. NPDC088785]|uniref:hypothetical protein n=1 Tax=Streptomyces sp. NPDC088785 TaxID=3365897 RepID=UPI003816FCEA
MDRDVGRPVRADPGVEPVEVGDDPDRDLDAGERGVDPLDEPGQVRRDRDVDALQAAQPGEQSSVEAAQVRLDADGDRGGVQAALDVAADLDADVPRAAVQRVLGRSG